LFDAFLQLLLYQPVQVMMALRAVIVRQRVWSTRRRAPDDPVVSDISIKRHFDQNRRCPVSMIAGAIFGPVDQHIELHEVPKRLPVRAEAMPRAAGCGRRRLARGIEMKPGKWWAL
jgi:hypothetical protein